MNEIYKEKKDGATISERIGDVWVFNPDQMGEQGLMETLVGRKEYIREVCTWLRENRGKVPEKHRLFHGRRGTGKTTLLLAIFYTILREQDLRDGFLPVKFAEDTSHMPFENTFVKETYDSLKKVADRLGIKEHFKKHAWTSNIEALSSFAKKTGRPFVFFIDNLHVFVKAVLESRGKKKGTVDEGSFLMQLLNRPEFLVVGASLEKLPREKRKGRPIHLIWARFELQPLSGLDSVREATELMEKRADHDKEMEVLRHLKRYTGRIRGVFRLSDGNPRYLVMLYKLLRRHEFEGVQTDFNKILDGLTGVIEGEMDRQITPKQKPVLKALCELGGRGKKKDVASRFLLPDEIMDEALEDQVGNTLSELTNTDFVDRDGKENGNQVYRTTPPLFQLWYEIRNLGRSHRIILLKIFDTFFPVPKQEVTTAYRSLIDALQRATPSDADFLGEALLYIGLTERPSAYFEDLMDLSRKAWAGEALDAVQTLSEFEETAHMLGKKDLRLFNQLLRIYSYLEKGDLDKTAESIDEILKKLDPGVDPFLAGHALRIKAETCLRREEIQSVLKHFDKALVLTKRLRLEGRVKLEGDLFSLAGRAYLEMGEVENAKKKFVAALKLHEEALDVANQISDMIALGESFSHDGNYEGAADWFQRALNLSRDSKDLKGEVRALQKLALSYSSIKKYGLATEFGQEAVEKFREVKDIEGEARALGNLAYDYGQMGEYDRAIEFGQETIEKSREAKDIEGEAFALGNLASDYGRMEEYGRAIEFGQEAVEKSRGAKDIGGEAFALRNLALSYSLMEEYGRAIEFGQEAVEKSREAKDIGGEAFALRNLADDYGRMGKYDRAIELGQEAVEKSREAEDIEGEASALRILASSYGRMEEYDRAIELGQEAVEKSREAMDIEGEAFALRDLAAYFGEKNNYISSRENGRKALKIFRGIGDRKNELAVLRNIIQASYDLKEYEKSLEATEELENIYVMAEDEEYVLFAHTMRFKCHLGLSRKAALEGNLPKAIEELLSAGGLRDFIPPEELGYQLYTLTFRELLFEGKNEEVFEMTRLLKSWTIEELTPHIMALETAAGNRLEPDKYPFKKLPPVERSMAYEFIRQAEGRKEAERAVALAKEGKYDEAMNILNETLDDSPDDLFIVRRAFLIALQAEWWDKAEFYAKEALSISEGDPVDLGNLGLALQEKGEINEAAKFFENAVNKGSTIFSHYNGLAVLKEQAKDFDGAATAMQKALNLSLSSDKTVTARHNLTEFLILLDRIIEADNTLKPLKLDALSPKQKTDHLFLLYLLSVLDQRRDAAAGILEDFCQNLIDNGEKAKSMFHYDHLLEYAQQKVGKEAKVLGSWVEVANGRIGINEFIQLFGTAKQKKRAISIWNDESGLALNRLISGRIKTLADIEKTSTRENAVEIALDTYTAQHDELNPELQAISRRLASEALKSEKASVARAGMESAGALFWRFKRLERKTVLTHLLEWARNESAPVIIRDAALRVMGALYFHLEKEEKEAVIGDLRLLSKEYNPEPLRDLFDRIGQAKEENK